MPVLRFPPAALATRALAATLAVGLAILGLGCARSPAGAGLGAIAVTLREAEARALIPEGDFAPASYLVEGSGPGGAAFRVQPATTATVVQELAAGSWTVTATALNAAAEPVLSGQAAAEVSPGQTQELAVVLTALQGTGSLELAVTWDPAAAQAPAPAGELVGASGARLALSLALGEPGRASGATAGIVAGWYTLLVRLYDGESLVAGAAEATLIRASATTRGNVDFGSATAAAPGALGVTLSTLSPSVRELLMAGQLGAVTRLQTVIAETSEPAGVTQTWYLDGVVVGSGSPVSLTCPATLGRHRLDAISLDAAGAAAGSASHAFTVGSSVQPGILTPNFVLSDGTLGVQGLRGARSAAVSPDGQNVYVTGYDADSVSIFTRSTATGLLKYAGRVANGVDGVVGLDGADGLALSPDGRHLYAAGYSSGAIAVFSRAPSGALTFVGSCAGLDGVRAVASSPDGAFLYAALYSANSVAVLARDSAAGTLSLASTVTNGASGVSFLEAPTDITVSGDGAHVYVTAYTSDALVSFRRDAETGALAPLGAARDGDAGVEGLNGAHGLAISPDDRSVLVAAYYDRSLTVFSRDPASGALSFASAAMDGTGGVDGLTYARDVAVSPSGSTVYVSGGGDDVVATFRRDPDSGTVSYLGTVAVPDGPRGLALSPDGRSLYVCAATAGSVAALLASP